MITKLEGKTELQLEIQLEQVLKQAANIMVEMGKRHEAVKNDEMTLSCYLDHQIDYVSEIIGDHLNSDEIDNYIGGGSC